MKMRKKAIYILAAILLALAASAVVASPEGEGPGGGEFILDDDHTKSGIELFAARYEPVEMANWFAYRVQFPKDPAEPIVARELDLKSPFTDFESPTAYLGLVVRPIMNLDVIKVLPRGFDPAVAEIFAKPIIVELSREMILARTGFEEIDQVYFVYEEKALEPDGFPFIEVLEDLESGSLIFEVRQWPRDDLMLIGEGH